MSLPNSLSTKHICSRSNPMFCSDRQAFNPSRPRPSHLVKPDCPDVEWRTILPLYPAEPYPLFKSLKLALQYWGPGWWLINGDCKILQAPATPANLDASDLTVVMSAPEPKRDINFVTHDEEEQLECRSAPFTYPSHVLALFDTEEAKTHEEAMVTFQPTSQILLATFCFQFPQVPPPSIPSLIHNPKTGQNVTTISVIPLPVKNVDAFLVFHNFVFMLDKVEFRNAIIPNKFPQKLVELNRLADFIYDVWHNAYALGYKEEQFYQTIDELWVQVMSAIGVALRA